MKTPKEYTNDLIKHFGGDTFRAMQVLLDQCKEYPMSDTYVKQVIR